MAQQAYVAAANEWPQQQQPQQLQVVSNGIQAIGVATTLAMPAIVGGGQQQQPQQYSPQDSNGSQSNSFYQQQLIKSAQQQFAVQQQQQQQQRMNGLSSEGLYNGVSAGVARPAPIYAPKATYYSQQQQPQQPLYQQTRAFYAPQQQQHSPAGQAGLMMQPGQLTASGLSVRQLSAANLPPQANGTAMLNHQPQQNSPQSSNLQQQVQSTEQRSQQMQQLIMSYQPPQFNQISSQTTTTAMQQPNYAAHNYHHDHAVHHQQQRQEQETRRSQIEEQHRLIQQQHLRQSARAARYSDRDSVSTVSRFNQFDERRSITMRSQYTSANNATKYSQKFGFLELTSEAFKRVLGLAGTDNTNSKPTDPSGAASSGATKITSIDSAEDYYFKRKVFKYQLVILRAVSFLCAAFVLLSPVAMLLIPRLESILRGSAESFAASGTDTRSEITATGSSQLQPSSPGIVTHAVGLSQANKQNQVNYFIPQPQWKISECTSDCDGPLIGFFARFIMLCIAYWAIFFRVQTSSLPRLDFHRCLLISMAVLLTLAYWLFFIFRVFDKRYDDFELQYMTIVQFALSMLESLILLHYLAVVLLELRERKKVYCLKVVRSPDGASQYLSCGSLSIQKCAQFVLEKYHREFKNFTPYHEHLLELEDELAKGLASSAAPRDRGGDKSPLTERSRANSPANSTSRSSRHHSHHHQSTSRPSRHHSRANSTQHRSPSRSPTRSSRGGHSRSQRKSTATANESQQPLQQHEATVGQQNQQNSSSNQTGSSQVKLYQVDLNPPKVAAANQDESAAMVAAAAETPKQPSATTNGQQKNSNNNNSRDTADNKADSNGENDSADQSSDATSRMKESSLETIRAANSTSELLSSQQQQQQHQPKSASAKQRSGSRARHGAQDAAQQQRDETESVRSVRSRRSTSRSQHRHREHHHHHHHHRERSSSRMNEHTSSHDDRRRSSNAISIPIDGADDPMEEHERKLKRRKYRLLLAVQDTFEQIRQLDEAVTTQNGLQQVDGSSTSLQQQPSPALSPNQAARSLYPSMARSLQKYLRLTKQTGRHNLQSIYEHLSKCLLYRLSPRTFLEKFLNQDPVWQQNETNLFARCRSQTTGDSMLLANDRRRFNDDLEINSWSLVCDTLLSRQIGSGTFFILKQGQISLLVTVAKLPHLNLTEEVIDYKSCRFVLAPNSETSV